MKRWDLQQWQWGEKGYPWFSWPKSASSRKALLVLLTIMALSGTFAIWYLSTRFDRSPDSAIGYSYAYIGMGFFLAALLAYTRKRRSHQRIIGQLNVALNWHTVFGLLGLFFLVLHSFGNLNPRSGTYALYGMIALAVSGIVGRILDRILPRLATNEVQTLTPRGEDRIESITNKLAALSHEGSGYPLQAAILPSSESSYWLGDPDAKPEIFLLQTARQQQTDEHLLALKQVQQAMMREQLYRYVIRFWRVFHKILALLTTGLMIWHIFYALQLLLQ